VTVFETPPVAQVDRRPVIGYGLYLVAAVLFALNGTVSKYLLLGGVPWQRLSQLRVTLAFIILLLIVAATQRDRLRLHRSEVPRLLVYGVLGIAATQSLYFLAIQKLPVGVALLFEFTAPIMVALWFRFVMREPVRDRVFAALLLAMVGLAMVAQVWQGFSLDVVGVTAGFGAAAALAVYYLLGERQSHAPFHRDAVSLTMWGFGAAALFWAVAQPWWSFPWADLGGTGQPMGADAPGVPLWALTAWMVVLGTVVPFWLVVASLHHLTAAQASVVGMSEPLIATAIAWFALGEVLAPVQVLGGVVVLVGIVLAETSR
jgi:drug/metabolite transporter (DMT)-like permease